jgi:hypothetical protein
MAYRKEDTLLGDVGSEKGALLTFEDSSMLFDTCGALASN